MAGSTIKVEGLKQLSRAVAACDEEMSVWLREGLLEIAEHVAVDVRAEYGRYSAVGAAGVKSKVMKSGSALVAQTLRKSRQQNRRRRNFGGLMMRHAFLPAAERGEGYALAAGESLLLQLEEKW